MTARYLGSDCGLKLGRQAAWRPGCNRNGVVSVAPAADQWMRVTSGTVLCGEEPQRRTAGEIVFQRLDPFKIKGKVNSVESFCRGTSSGSVTSASMSTAVTHRLDFLHVEADGARWHTPPGALPEVSARRRWSSATIPSTTCTPIPRSLICFQTTRSTTWAPTQYGSEWAVDCFEHAVALRRQWRLRLQRWLTGLRAGFVCAVGTMMGSVDEVVCEGGNCAASVLGQGLSIHETGHL